MFLHSRSHVFCNIEAAIGEEGASRSRLDRELRPTQVCTNHRPNYILQYYFNSDLLDKVKRTPLGSAPRFHTFVQ